MKACCISDLHGHLPEASQLNSLTADVLLIAGDIVPSYAHNVANASLWLDTTFRNWLNKLKMPVIGVAGNHDFIFQKAKKLIPKSLPWTYLEDSGIQLEGFSIWGSPWQPVFHNWAFNAPEERLKLYWDFIPSNTDILITHGPPRGYGDYSIYGHEHAGSYTLLDRVSQLKQLKLHCFGHIHSGVGTYKMGEATLVNASYVDENYKPCNPPTIIEI